MFLLEKSIMDMAVSGLSEGCVYGVVFHQECMHYLHFFESGIFSGFFESRGLDILKQMLECNGNNDIIWEKVFSVDDIKSAEGDYFNLLTDKCRNLPEPENIFECLGVVVYIEKKKSYRDKHSLNYFSASKCFDVAAFQAAFGTRRTKGYTCQQLYLLSETADSSDSVYFRGDGDEEDVIPPALAKTVGHNFNEETGLWEYLSLSMHEPSQDGSLLLQQAIQLRHTFSDASVGRDIDYYLHTAPDDGYHELPPPNVPDMCKCGAGYVFPNGETIAVSHIATCHGLLKLEV
ncbi:hypothetical protein CHS0354_021635 [Potamilus streckersoni]|uniref:Uncharacterized protein n=1 Tax=Potamilus streckersoni TaxID=2493646 RepID=A0AAE0VZ49_9BIVA|nr:hypothetical protein CHS0354_021635 [Potamilus streckersoni]